MPCIFNSASSTLPLSETGNIGPANNVLGANQSTQFISFDFLPFLAQTQRPIQLELAWSSRKAAIMLDAVTSRISRQRDPGTGAVLQERARHALECRTISAR